MKHGEAEQTVVKDRAARRTCEGSLETFLRTINLRMEALDTIIFLHFKTKSNLKADSSFGNSLQ